MAVRRRLTAIVVAAALAALAALPGVTAAAADTVDPDVALQAVQAAAVDSQQLAAAGYFEQSVTRVNGVTTTHTWVGWNPATGVSLNRSELAGAVTAKLVTPKATYQSFGGKAKARAALRLIGHRTGTWWVHTVRSTPYATERQGAMAVTDLAPRFALYATKTTWSSSARRLLVESASQTSTAAGTVITLAGRDLSGSTTAWFTDAVTVDVSGRITGFISTYRRGTGPVAVTTRSYTYAAPAISLPARSRQVSSGLYAQALRLVEARVEWAWDGQHYCWDAVYAARAHGHTHVTVADQQVAWRGGKYINGARYTVQYTPTTTHFRQSFPLGAKPYTVGVDVTFGAHFTCTIVTR